MHQHPLPAAEPEPIPAVAPVRRFPALFEPPEPGVIVDYEPMPYDYNGHGMHVLELFLEDPDWEADQHAISNWLTEFPQDDLVANASSVLGFDKVAQLAAKAETSDDK